MHRSKYLRNTFAASTAKVNTVLLNNVSKTYLRARSMHEKQRTIKALPYFVPTYKLIFRR